MQRDENIFKKILHIVCRCILYVISTIIILTVVAIFFIRIIYFYEENKFIKDCVKEGNSEKQCQSVWVEVDALD